MKEKIKVLVVDGIYPPAYTGSGLRAHRTYKRLSRIYPLEFSVLTTTRGGFKAKFDIYDDILIYRTKSNKSFISQIIQVYRLFKKYNLNEFDVIHGFGDSLVVLAACLVAKYHSMKLIYELTVLATENKKAYGRFIKDIVNYYRFGFSKNIIYKKVDFVIALNESIKQHYIRHGVPNDKIWKRPNPVDTEKFYLPCEREKISIRRDLNLPETASIILVVGKFEPRKNQKFALEVMRILPDNYYLLMIGPKDVSFGWYYDEIYRDIHKNGIYNRIKIFLGYQDDVEKYFKVSDILWVPSLSEGTPNVMLEAMCCGIPVVVNKDLNLGEYIKNGENGFEERLVARKFLLCTIASNKITKNKQMRKIISIKARNKLNPGNIDKHFIYKLENLLKN